MARIVILGGGFGGLEAAHEARKYSNDEILLIDQSTVMTMHAHLQEIVSGRIKPEALEIQLQKNLSKRKIAFLQAKVLGVKKKYVETSKGSILYDSLIIALGSKTRFSVKGIPRSDELKQVAHAIKLKEHLARLNAGRVVVVGAGLTGTELAFEIQRFAKKHNKGFDLHIVEASDNVMPGFPFSAREFAHRIMSESMNVHLGKRISKGVGHELVFEDGSKLSYDLLIWTAGITPSFNAEGIERVQGFIHSDAYLQSSRPGVFAIGDAAWVDVGHSHDLWSAVTAMYQGRIAGRNAVRFLKHQKLLRYEPQKKHLFLVSLGRKTGILTYGNFMMHGKTILFLKWLFRKWYLKTRA